ncbi:MAG: preprotein translocase subunit SecE [Pseudomonadota bacterium]
MKNPVQFVDEVRSEVRKVVWPTRKEAGLTTAMVLLMALLCAIFFFFVDQILTILVDTFILGR